MRYEWERFLQQQDHKTEKYMELLERYLDDPQRDQIIAREMGWTQLLDTNDWSAEVDAMLDEEANDESEESAKERISHAETLRGPQPLSGRLCPNSLDRSAI